MGRVFSLARRCWVGLGWPAGFGRDVFPGAAVVEPVGIIIVGSCGARVRCRGEAGRLGSDWLRRPGTGWVSASFDPERDVTGISGDDFSRRGTTSSTDMGEVEVFEVLGTPRVAAAAAAAAAAAVATSAPCRRGRNGCATGSDVAAAGAAGVGDSGSMSVSGSGSNTVITSTSTTSTGGSSSAMYSATAGSLCGSTLGSDFAVS